VDLVIESGVCGVVPSTIVDMTGSVPVIMREGVGSPELLGMTVGA
jgi:tRNA A37 threonylcarbamoyladenosine synthetase subunit TsaC/SUA5/YrdC